MKCGNNEFKIYYVIQLLSSFVCIQQIQYTHLQDLLVSNVDKKTPIISILKQIKLISVLRSTLYSFYIQYSKLVNQSLIVYCYSISISLFYFYLVILFLSRYSISILWFSVDFGVSAQLDKTIGRRNTFIGTPYWYV